MNFVFVNNRCCAGITAAIYKVSGDYYNRASSISLSYETNGQSKTYDVYNGSQWIENDDLKIKGWTVGSYQDTNIRSAFIVIKNLIADSQYTITCTIQIPNQNSVVITDSFRTLPGPNGTTTFFKIHQNASISTITANETYGGTDTEECINALNTLANTFNTCMDMLNEFGTTGSNYFTPPVIDSEIGANVAATSDMRFIPRYIDNRSIMIHEIAHNYSYNWNGTVDKTCIRNLNELSQSSQIVVEFMEFATDSPNSMWKWMGRHCYPVISSSEFDLVDDYLIIVAIFIMMNNTQ